MTVDLFDQVKSGLGVSDTAARRALGTVFRAVRMTVNANEFNAVHEMLPQVDDWLRDAPVGGGRTAEMLAVVGPEGLEQSLTETGLAAQQIEKLYGIVGRKLAELEPALGSKIAEQLPMLKA